MNVVQAKNVLGICIIGPGLSLSAGKYSEKPYCNVTKVHVHVQPIFISEIACV